MPERTAGICLHLTSLPGPYGIGEMGAAARQFIDQLNQMGIGVWQILPLGPTAYGNSPYQPLSAFAGNPLLIDLEYLRERNLLTARELAPLTDLPQDQVDYGNLIPLKFALLELAAGRFHEQHDGAALRDFSNFVARHDEAWLHQYALFQVLKNQHGQLRWHEWAHDYAMRDPQALKSLEGRCEQQIGVVKIIQYLFFSQWRQLKDYATNAGVKLFGDVPIYIALDSAEAWAQPELLQLNDKREPSYLAGVPPDYFSEDGQRWGNPLYDWPVHEAQGYAWWHQRLRHAMSLHDLIRLDHFRAFESYWAIPAWSETAREGEWRAGPGDAVFQNFQDESGPLPIIAEDLGIITDEVEALRLRCGFPGMKVLQFMIEDEHFHADQIPEDSVCYTGTHDNDTIVGWLHGSSTENASPEHLEYRRRRAGVLTQTDQLCAGLVRLALATPARLAVVPMQDLLGLDSIARMNTPGTTGNNWRWRMQFDQVTGKLVRDVREWVSVSGRLADQAESHQHPLSGNDKHRGT